MKLLLALLLVALPMPVAAQSVTLSPTKVEFSASLDHASLLGGAPILTGYQLDVKNPAGAIALSTSLGKPAPDTITGCAAPSPCLSVVVPGFSTLPKNVVYTATVSAVGPSVASGPFTFPVPGAPGKPGVK